MCNISTKKLKKTYSNYDKYSYPTTTHITWSSPNHTTTSHKHCYNSNKNNTYSPSQATNTKTLPTPSSTTSSPIPSKQSSEKEITHQENLTRKSSTTYSHNYINPNTTTSSISGTPTLISSPHTTHLSRLSHAHGDSVTYKPYNNSNPNS